MAIRGNRSPSPTTNSRPNLISRNSELNSSPVRKSFCANNNPSFQRPLRNGPSDSSNRNYLTQEEKENDTDHHILKQAKTRSPSVPKATNHFMIPTISAASKINPSPRKKVLGDRNEPTRTSLSFSGDKSPFSLLDCDKKSAKASVESPFNPNVSPKISNIAPLDADPSLPPYDPKTNFLSPRPQFLHYRPNPRLGHYYQEQGNGIKNLEDSFLCESSSSDNEVSEGSAVDSPHRVSEDSSSAEGITEHSQKEADDISSVEVVYNRNEQPITAQINDKSELKHSQNEVEDVSIVEVDSPHRVSEDSSSVEGINEHSQNEADDVSSVEVVYNRNEHPITTQINDKSELKHSQYEVEDVSIVEVVNENFRIEIEDSSSVEVVNSKADLEVLETEPISTMISEISELSKGAELEVKTENMARESKATPLVDIASKDDGQKFSDTELIMNPHHILKETTSKEKREVKSRLFSRGKFIHLLLFLLFGCFLVSSIIDSPISDVPVYKVLRSSKFYEERFNGFARNIKIWSDYSTSYVNEVISSFTRVEKLGPIQFFNLTYNQDDPFIGMTWIEEISFEAEDEFERLLDENLEGGNQSMMNEHDVDIVCDLPRGIDFEEKSEVIEEDHADEFKRAEEDSDIESSTNIPSFKNTMKFNLEELASKVVEEYHVCNSEISETMTTEGGSDSEIVSSFENTLEEGCSQVDPEYNYEKTENVEIKYGNPHVSDSEIEPIKVESVIENTLQINDSTSDLMPDYKSSNLYKTLAISLLVLALVAAPILIYLKNKNRSYHNSTLKSKTVKSGTGPQSYSPESEMSSSFNGSYSYSKGCTWGITNEAHSKERKRESLASSSGFSVSDSPSYGSFTTYERLSKHGFGDDEVVTPVRRSSRIKKIQVASP